MRAAVYCRISRDRKVEGTHTMLGVERQEKDCRETANRLGWEVVEVFVDNDISATTGKTRPAYRRMLAAAEAGTIDAIVCWHPDRLYRRAVDLEELVRVCDATRVPIATVNAGSVDLTTPSGRLVAGLLAQVAKYEGEHKSERWRSRYMQNREAGKPPPSGPRCFGWNRDGTVRPEEADALRLVATHLLEGGSLNGGCRILTDLGFKTTFGNTWGHNSLRKLMSNPRLAGWVTYKGELMGKGDFEPILDEDTHQAVAALVGKRVRTGAYAKVAVLLDVAHCGVCGHRLVTGRRAEGRRTRVYRCPPKGEGGKGCVSVMAEPVEKMVEGLARRRWADPAFRERVHNTRSDGQGAKIIAEIVSLEQRVLALNAELANVDEGRPVPEIVGAISKLRARIAEAQDRLAAIGPSGVWVDGNEWPTDLERRRALIQLAVHVVYIDPVPRDNTSGSFRPERVRMFPREQEVAVSHPEP